MIIHDIIQVGNPLLSKKAKLVKKKLNSRDKKDNQKYSWYNES